MSGTVVDTLSLDALIDHDIRSPSEIFVEGSLVEHNSGGASGASVLKAILRDTNPEWRKNCAHWQDKPVFVKAFRAGPQTKNLQYEFRVFHRLRDVLQKSSDKDDLREFVIEPIRFVKHVPVTAPADEQFVEYLVITENTGGESLMDRLIKGEVDTTSFLACVQQVLYGLYKLNVHGIVHNDITLANVIAVDKWTKERTFVFDGVTVKSEAFCWYQCKIYDYDRSVRTFHDFTEAPNPKNLTREDGLTVFDNASLNEGGLCSNFGQCSGLNTERDVYALYVVLLQEANVNEGVRTFVENYLNPALWKYNAKEYTRLLGTYNNNANWGKHVFRFCRNPEDNLCDLAFNPLLNVVTFALLYSEAFSAWVQSGTDLSDL